MNDKLDEMWAALAAYQARADAAGHGASWAIMCSERNAGAAFAANYAAKGTNALTAAYAAAWAAAAASADAAAWAAAPADIKYCAQQAIDHINKAQRELAWLTN
jgi:hypothetical protein